MHKSKPFTMTFASAFTAGGAIDFLGAGWRAERRITQNAIQRCFASPTEDIDGAAVSEFPLVSEVLAPRVRQVLH